MTSNPFTISDSGWTVVFCKISGGASEPIIIPGLTPTETADVQDKVLAASVILPESGAANQYWVPVSENSKLLGKCFAQLQTADWTVLFFREPTS